MTSPFTCDKKIQVAGMVDAKQPKSMFSMNELSRCLLVQTAGPEYPKNDSITMKTHILKYVIGDHAHPSPSKE